MHKVDDDVVILAVGLGRCKPPAGGAVDLDVLDPAFELGCGVRERVRSLAVEEEANLRRSPAVVASRDLAHECVCEERSADVLDERVERPEDEVAEEEFERQYKDWSRFEWISWRAPTLDSYAAYPGTRTEVTEAEDDGLKEEDERHSLVGSAAHEREVDATAVLLRLLLAHFAYVLSRSRVG